MQQPRYSPALPSMRPQQMQAGSRAPHPTIPNVSFAFAFTGSLPFSVNSILYNYGGISPCGDF